MNKGLIQLYLLLFIIVVYFIFYYTVEYKLKKVKDE